ncbi:hypothetical protein BLNAU_13687 [Blattamonas nauphoetae]|uniref:Uncharacterized protein n=1 Tax=Blattamonas nauphoetae TaxID=2049346 RepID=A0ABQ9XJ45_9EUKA|nr:hypothetical protein BLNAU_13687 [Blattamonas nauphoetae]
MCIIALLTPILVPLHVLSSTQTTSLNHILAEDRNTNPRNWKNSVVHVHLPTGTMCSDELEIKSASLSFIGRDSAILHSHLDLKHVHFPLSTGPLIDIRTKINSKEYYPVTCALSTSSCQFHNATSSTEIKHEELQASTNHLYGTACVDINSGGSHLSLNTSFWSCHTNLVPSSTTNSSYILQHRSGTSAYSFNDTQTYTSTMKFQRCTFHTMSATENGAALRSLFSPAPILITECSFYRCTISKDFGGAIAIAYEDDARKAVTLQTCSFMACSASDHGGSVYLQALSAVTTTYCYFYQNKVTTDTAQRGDGGAIVVNTVTGLISFSNSVFEQNSATFSGGALSVWVTTRLKLTSLMFRMNKAAYGYDFFLWNSGTIYSFSSNITFCESTSYDTRRAFYYVTADEQGYQNDDFPTPTQSTCLAGHTLTTNTDGKTATLSVVVSNKITETALVLLSNIGNRTGSSPPAIQRLVVLQFSSSTTSTNSTLPYGTNGIIQSSVSQYGIIAAGITKRNIVTFTATMEPVETDTDETMVALIFSFTNLPSESYTTDMYVILDDLNTSTTYRARLDLDEDLLVHSSELYPPLEVGFRYGHSYQIIRVSVNGVNAMLPDSGFSFTLLEEPPRVEKAIPNQLNGHRTEVTVTLTGRAFTQEPLTVKVSRGGTTIESLSQISVTDNGTLTVIFNTDFQQSSTHLAYGQRYVVSAVSNATDSFFVNSDVNFTVPNPPTVKSIVSTLAGNCTHFQIAMTGTDLPTSGVYVVTLSSGFTFDVTFSSTGAKSSFFEGNATGSLDFNTTYEIESILQNDNIIFFTQSSFTTSEGPTLKGITAELNQSNLNEVVLSLTGVRMAVSQYTLLLRKVGTSNAFQLVVYFSSTTDGTESVEVYNQTGTLEYDVEYEVISMHLSSLSVTILTTITFPTPPAPTRIISASCALGGQFEKQALINLNGVALPAGKTISITVSELDENGNVIRAGIALSSIIDGQGMLASTLLKEDVFLPSPVKLKYGTQYLLTDLSVEDVPSILDNGVMFEVPPEPSRLTTIVSSPLYSNQDKELSLDFIGIKLTGSYSLFFSVNGSSTAPMERTVPFGSDGKGTMEGVLFNTDPTMIELQYNTAYEVIEMKDSNKNPIFIESSLSFSTIKEPTRLLGVGEPVDKDDRNVTTISLTGHAALEGSYELDLENSEDSTEKVTIDASFTATDAGEAQAKLYPTRQLKYGETYKVTGMVGTMSNPPKIHVEAGLTITLDSEPSRLTFMGPATPQNKQKEVSISLIGIKLTNGPFTIALNGSKTITATFAADGESGSSTAILFSTTESEIEVEYDQTYTVLGVTDEDSKPVFIHSGLSFTTPAEPTRLVSLSIVEYDSLKKNVLVSMDGRQLDISSKYEVDLSRASSCDFTLLMEWNSSSSRWEGSASLFPTLTADLVFGGNYSIVEFRKQSISTPLFFEPNSIEIIPEPPRLTAISSIPTYSNLDKETTFTLHGILLSGDFILTLTRNASTSSNTDNTIDIDVSFSSSSATVSRVLFDTDASKVNFEYNTRYEVDDLKQGADSVLIERGLGFTTIKEPTRLLGVGEPVDKNDKNVTTISLTGHAAMTGQYELDLENSKDSTEKVTIDASFTATDAGEAQATLYPTRQLKYGETYKVTGMIGTMSNPPKIHVEAGLTITLDPEPSRLTFMGPATPQNKQKEVSISLIGIKMTNGPFTIALNGSKTIKASFAADGESGSSTAILFSTTESEIEVEYGQTYTVVGVTDKDDNEVFFHAGLSFTTPAEQTRLVSFSIVDYDSLKKNVLVTMDGRQLDISSKYEVDLSRALLKEHTLTMEWNSSSSRWEGSASLFPTLVADLVFGGNYSIVDLRQQSVSTPLFFEPNSIEIIPEPPRLVSINSADNDILTTATLTLNSTQLVAGTAYRLTFSETPRSSTNAATTSEVQIDVTATETGMMTIELGLYPSSTAILKYSHYYSVESMTEKAQSSPVLIEKSDCVFSTPYEPTRIESGSATLNSQRDTATIVVAGRELQVGTYFIVIESGGKSFSTTATTTTKGELSFTAPTEYSSDPSTVLFGLVYSFKTVKLDGSDVFVNSDASVRIPLPPLVTNASFAFSASSNRKGTIKLTGTDLPTSSSYLVTTTPAASFTLTFSSSTSGTSADLSLGNNGVMDFSTVYTLTSIVKVGDPSDVIHTSGVLTFETGEKPRQLQVIVKDGGHSDTLDCGEYAKPCDTIANGWKRREAEGVEQELVTLQIDIVASFGACIAINRESLQIVGLHSTTPRVVVDHTLSCTSAAQRGVVWVDTGHLRLESLVLELPSFSLSTSPVPPLYVVMGRGTFSCDSVTITNQHGERVGIGLASLSEGQLDLSRLTYRVQHVLSEQHTPLILISQAHSSFEMSNCVFERSGCVDQHATFISSVLHLTHTANSFPSSAQLSAAIVISTTKTPSSVSFPHSWFESTTSSSPPYTRNRDGVPLMNWKRKVTFPSSSSPIAVLVERGALLPAVSRTGSVFCNTQFKVSATKTEKP